MQNNNIIIIVNQIIIKNQDCKIYYIFALV